MPSSPIQRRALLLCLLFLAGWALRLRTLHPAFHTDDSPETATAAAVLGIQHPPGYPLPTLLGALACRILPGAPAFASNLLAALASVLAVLLAFAWLTQLLGARPAVAWVPWLLALSLLGLPQLWFQGLSAKGGIYTLNLCFSLAALWGAWRAASPQSPRWALPLSALAFGLGLAGHYMSVVALAPAGLLWSRAWNAEDKKRSWPWIVVGLSLYLYLPLRARMHPALNWGDPSTLEGLWQVLTRSQYAGAGEARGIDNTLRLSWHFLTMLPQQLSWPGLLLSLSGLRLAWLNKELGLRPLLAGLATHLFLVLAYNNPPAHAPWVINAFFLPEFVLLLLLAGLGLADAIERLPAARRMTACVGLGVALSALLLTRVPQLDHSDDYLLYDYSQDLLLPLPRHAALLGAGGNDTFGVWYIQKVLKRRQDIVLVDVPLLGGWYTRQLQAQAPDLPWEAPDRDGLLRQWLASDLKRQLYHTSHNPGDRGIPLGLVTLVPGPRQQLSLSAEKLALPWLALRQRFLLSRAPIDGNRAELWQYYPDSAQALRSFAQRMSQAPLAQWAEARARSLQIP